MNKPALDTATSRKPSSGPAPKPLVIRHHHPEHPDLESLQRFRDSLLTRRKDQPAPKPEAAD